MSRKDWFKNLAGIEFLTHPLRKQGYMGAAMAAASTGLRPIAELMFNDFIGSCLDEVLNQGAKFRYMFGGKAREFP